MTAQVVTITEVPNEYLKIKKITWQWTTDGTGGAIVDSTTAGEINKTTNKYTGELCRLVTVPSNSPTDNYDVTILDDDGVDVLMGAGQNRDVTTTEQVLGTSLGVCLDSQLRLNIAAAGNTKSGKVYLYIK